MFRLIRVRLALSYAGIALLVTLSLGAVLLLRLHSYYADMEMTYLENNARAISSLAVSIFNEEYPKEIRDAQVSNLAFLYQTRVRILDVQQHVLADSGSWRPAKIDLGVIQESRRSVPADGSHSEGRASVIILYGRSSIGAISGNLEQKRLAVQGDILAPEPPNVLFFNSSVPLSAETPELYLNKSPVGSGERSDQIVQAPVVDASGRLLGVVEISESPAYGRDIVNSVASGLAVAGGLAILLAIGAGWLTSRRFTAPLVCLTQATQQMSGGDLSVRVAEAKRTDEFGTLGKSFNQMAGRIEETVQTLRRFLADAAHELQTPLTALRTNLELARSEENSASRAGELTEALEQIERIQRMIKDLLSLSRLESATAPEAFQEINLEELARQVSEPFAACAEQAGQSFELALTASDPRVMGSPEKLRSALGNLLDNALKFTPSGGVVTLGLAEDQENVILSVSDTGIGIPPDEVEVLFNRFHRGRNTSAYPGSGLGLAIVRAIARTHGGSVKATNNLQGGARFTLCLPRCGSAADPNAK
jgi:signal transduction histidine kinase